MFSTKTTEALAHSNNKEKLSYDIDYRYSRHVFKVISSSEK